MIKLTEAMERLLVTGIEREGGVLRVEGRRLATARGLERRGLAVEVGVVIGLDTEPEQVMFDVTEAGLDAAIEIESREPQPA